MCHGLDVLHIRDLQWVVVQWPKSATQREDQVVLVTTDCARSQDAAVCQCEVLGHFSFLNSEPLMLRYCIREPSALLCVSKHCINS